MEGRTDMRGAGEGASLGSHHCEYCPDALTRAISPWAGLHFTRVHSAWRLQPYAGPPCSFIMPPEKSLNYIMFTIHKT